LFFVCWEMSKARVSTCLVLLSSYTITPHSLSAGAQAINPTF
jgi:hypothetical protein